LARHVPQPLWNIKFTAQPEAITGIHVCSPVEVIVSKLEISKWRLPQVAYVPHSPANAPERT
jgi:hypothetical protein